LRLAAKGSDSRCRLQLATEKIHFFSYNFFFLMLKFFFPSHTTA
jgi:hypothetical protein